MSPASTTSSALPARDWSGFEDLPLGPRALWPSVAPPSGSEGDRPAFAGSSTGQQARPVQSQVSTNGEAAAPPSLPVAVTDRWEGVVTEVGEECFVGDLARTYGTGPDLIAEFNLDAVDDDDRALVQPGAWFYVIVGRVRGPGNRSSTVSTVRFRRLPTWREEELQVARERAAKRRVQLGLDADD